MVQMFGMKQGQCMNPAQINRLVDLKGAGDFPVPLIADSIL